MSRASRAALAGALLFTACGGGAPGSPDVGPGLDAAAEPDGGELVECGAPLSAVTSSAAVEALQLFTVRAQGGSGRYRFGFIENASGATLNEQSGAYLSGETGGVVDRIEVRDEACPGSAEVTIRVVSPMDLRPRAAEVPPGTRWRFLVEGGSGRFVLRPIALASGGSLDSGGDYEAGPRPGVDRVEARDLATGRTVEASITVAVGASFEVVPEVALIGEAQRFTFSLLGGSGEMEVEGLPAFLEQTGPRTLSARGEGQAELTLRDRFTGQTARVGVRAAAPLVYPATRAGDLVDRAALAAGDLDGDGRPDLVLGHPDADPGAANGGAVFVYRGQVGGAELVQTLPGGARGARLGTALALADLDGDGVLDLAVGSPGADVGASGNGAAQIFSGRGDGSFSPEPSARFAGRIAGDELGSALAACDFDGDGRLDLAVGARGAEDRARAVRAFNQGAVLVYRGAERGFSATPDTILWGDLPDETGTLAGVGNLRYGEQLAAADVDGDGRCDLVVGAPEWDQRGETDDGLVALHLGRADRLLEKTPAALFATLDPEDRGARLGFSVAAADLDGDGRAEIVAGQPGHDAGSGDSHGAVRVFPGGAPPAPLRVRAAATSAIWSYVHPGSYDDAGWSVALGDLDGDGDVDLLVGAVDAELGGGPSGAGVLFGFLNAGSGLEASATRLHGGEGAGDRLGVAAAVLGDLDGDGAAEVAAWAGRDDRHGSDVGAPLVFFGAPDTPAAALALPGPPSGSRFAASLAAIGDLNGDGRVDLVAGAPAGSPTGLGRAAGAAYVYASRSGGGGAGGEPRLALSGFVGHDAGDELGAAVTGLGDFDGDGVEDFAVVARSDDLPPASELDPASYEVDPACPAGGASNVGAAYVFRGAVSGTPSATPALVVFGSEVGDGIETAAGGFDYDGDGRGDLALGSTRWDRDGASDVGGVRIVLGRRPVGFGRTSIVCMATVGFHGRVAGDRLGAALAGVGDVDGDGCEELAVGAPGQDDDGRDAGEVLVLFGAGGAGCPAEPRMVHLRAGAARSETGSALAGGVDADGDGVPDLAIGLPGYDVGEAVGAAALVSGAWLARLSTEVAQDATPPSALGRFLDANPQIVLGEGAGARAGAAVALFRTASGGALALGAPGGQRFGPAGSGYVVAHRVGAGGIEPRPYLGMSGETQRAGGALGASLVAGPGLLGVGGPTSSAVAPDNGAAYAFPLDL